MISIEIGSGTSSRRRRELPTLPSQVGGNSLFGIEVVSHRAAPHCGPGFARVCHNRQVGDATTCPKQLHLFPSGPLNL